MLLYCYTCHNYDTNKQISENEVAQEDEDDSKPLTVRSFVKIFLNFSPAIHLRNRMNQNVMDQKVTTQQWIKQTT